MTINPHKHPGQNYAYRDLELQVKDLINNAVKELRGKHVKFHPFFTFMGRYDGVMQIHNAAYDRDNHQFLVLVYYPYPEAEHERMKADMPWMTENLHGGWHGLVCFEFVETGRDSS